MTADRRTLYVIGLLGLLVLLLVALDEVLFPFVAGIALAYLLDPFADLLERWRVPRWLAAGLITFLVVLVVIAAALLLVPLLQAELLEFAGRVPRYVDLLRGKAMELMELLRARLTPEEIEQVRSQIGSMAAPDAIAWVGGALGRLWGGGMALLNLLSLLVITPIVLFYLLRDWDRIVAIVDGWLPLDTIDTVHTQFRAIDGVLSGFVRGQLSVCLLLGVFYAVGLMLVGLDFGFVIGFGTGLISFVPYFGMLVGFAVGLGVAVAQFGDWQPIALVAGVFMIGQFMEGNFFTPKLVGERVGLHPVWVIFALLAGGALFGFTGILLAVPAAAVIGVLGRFAIGHYKQSAAYGVDPGGAEPPPK
ncbi:MAG: AI-2E family transporter [Alphaproteobacteria bacterium]